MPKENLLPNGQLSEEYAKQCEALSCPLFSRPQHLGNIPACEVLLQVTNNQRPRWIAVQGYKTRIPKECPEGFFYNESDKQ